MNVLVTGGTGYIGSHVVEKLLEYDENIEVWVLDTRTLDNDSDRIHNICCSMGDFIAQESNMAVLQSMDACIHMAWRDGFVHESMNHIKDLPMHYEFLSKLVDLKIPKIAAMGTAHEIGYWEGMIQKDTPCNPKSLYGMSKDLLRRLLFKKIKDTDTKLFWLRAYYILGDDMHNKSIFTKLLEAEQRGQKTFPFTSGKNKFDFIDVGRLAEQIVASVMQDEYDGIIECCSGKPVSLGERVEEYIKTHNFSIELEYNKFPNRIDESPILYGDSSIIDAIMAKSQWR